MTGFRLEVATGATRSGKSFETHRRTKSEKNLLVWDAMGEFANDFRCKRVTSAAQLRSIAARGLPGRWAFVVKVTPANFDLFCRAAWLWIRVQAHRKRSICLVVEELADVTPPGKAPAAWGEIVRKSMRYGAHIYALTQRPAESDKTVMGNATVLRCHSMSRAPDRAAMAVELDVHVDQVKALDRSRYQYLERDQLTGKLTTAGKGIRTRRA